MNTAKNILALFLVLCAVANVYSQQDTKEKFIFKDRFISSGGLFFAHPANSAITTNYSGISFLPGLNLLNSFSDFSIAFGTRLDVGYRLSSGVGNSKLMASIPAVITLNAGHLASRDFYGSYGIFGGGGYDFCFIEGMQQKGFMWTAGVRTWFLKKSFTLRYSQLMPDESKITMHIFSLELNFGSYLEKVYKNNQISRFVKPLRR